ncbi:MAG: YkgJ family cysteine cluster protein [Candidatus Dojkabacteria bacterium]|nr:YkgJ family cysteine cluster protein [Candidatus Dojkabacteria bacterium]
MLPFHKRLLEEFNIKKLLKEYGGCQQCGRCCKNERLTIFKEDVIRLGLLLKSEHIQRRDDVCVTLKLPCPFLNKNRCNVYNKRSDVCKTYPFLFHYIGMFTVVMDCPLGKKIYDDIIKFCEYSGIKIVGDESKTEEMKFIDRLVEDKKLNSGDGYSSKITNVPFDLFREFLNWRNKNI